jgi:hypothetical protein
MPDGAALDIYDRAVLETMGRFIHSAKLLIVRNFLDHATITRFEPGEVTDHIEEVGPGESNFSPFQPRQPIKADLTFPTHWITRS